MRLAGLRVPSSPEITTPSKSLVEQVVGIAVHAPRVGHERCANARLRVPAAPPRPSPCRAARPRTAHRSSPSGPRRGSPRSAPRIRPPDGALLQRDQAARANSGSAPKRLPSSSGSISMRTQYSWKDAKRLLVSTPPQSIRRPVRPLRVAPSGYPWVWRRVGGLRSVFPAGDSRARAESALVAHARASQRRERHSPRATSSAWRASSSTPSPNCLR